MESKALRKGMLGIHLIDNWQLEASEPKPVVLTSLADSASLSIPLTMTVQTNDGKEPSDLKACRCIYSLASSTFITIVPRKSLPTLQEVTAFATLTRRPHKCAKACDIARFSRWQASNTREAHPQWQAETTLNVGFWDSKHPIVPSFDSSLVSHRYKVSLRVQVAGPYRTTFCLEVPVQILYQSYGSRLREAVGRSEAHLSEVDIWPTDDWRVLSRCPAVLGIECPPYAI